MESRRFEVVGEDGRRLEAEVAGPEDGELLVFHNGTPEAGMVDPPMVEAGAARGFRHLTYSRPGYGESDRVEGRLVADCAVDVEAVVGELGVERFYTAGASGGGPHALATAALLGQRVIAAATLAGVAPYGAEGLDWGKGMGDENEDEFAAALAGPRELEAYLEGEAGDLRSATGAEIATALGDLVGEADRAALSGAYGDYIAGHLRAALRNGIWGWFDDDVAFISDWGIDLGTIAVPVTVWWGGDDRFVPPTHGRWLADHVAGAEARFLPDEGHLSIELNHYGAILDGLRAAG
jgi:pimeloyl-ACP methyl ester carboxylesterase